MAFTEEVANAVHGAWRLACRDPRGLALFETGETGFWHSFRAAYLCYPVYLVLTLTQLGAEEMEHADWLRIVLAETIAYVIGWVAFPLLMLPVTNAIGKGARWVDFIIVYNWSQILQYAVFLAATAIAGSAVVSESAAFLVMMAALVATLVYEWIVVRIAPGASGLATAGILVLDEILATALGRVAHAMH
jgi:hypothetical protein